MNPASSSWTEFWSGTYYHAPYGALGELKMKTLETLIHNASVRTWPSGAALDGRANRCRLEAATMLASEPIPVERIDALFADSRMASEVEAHLLVTASLIADASDATDSQRENAAAYRARVRELFAGVYARRAA